MRVLGKGLTFGSVRFICSPGVIPKAQRHKTQYAASARTATCDQPRAAVACPPVKLTITSVIQENAMSTRGLRGPYLLVGGDRPVASVRLNQQPARQRPIWHPGTGCAADCGPEFKKYLLDKLNCNAGKRLLSAMPRMLCLLACTTASQRSSCTAYLLPANCHNRAVECDCSFVSWNGLCLLTASFLPLCTCGCAQAGSARVLTALAGEAAFKSKQPQQRMLSAQ